jgi:hypothetical protein
MNTSSYGSLRGPKSFVDPRDLAAGGSKVRPAPATNEALKIQAGGRRRPARRDLAKLRLGHVEADQALVAELPLDEICRNP